MIIEIDDENGRELLSQLQVQGVKYRVMDAPPAAQSGEPVANLYIYEHDNGDKDAQLDWRKGVKVLDLPIGTHPLYTHPQPAPCDSAQSVDGGNEPIYEHLCQKLIAALKQLSFAAQTSGGTAGHDPDLVAAINNAERAMGLVSISKSIDFIEQSDRINELKNTLNQEIIWRHQDQEEIASLRQQLEAQQPVQGVDGFALLPIEGLRKLTFSFDSRRRLEELIASAAHAAQEKE